MFFDLSYKTGGCNVGKSYLLNTYAYGDLSHTWKSKKTFNNEHGSKLYDFFWKFSDLSFNLCLFALVDNRYHKIVHLDHDRTVTLTIENLSALRRLPTIYPQDHLIHASIVVYDITQRDSFEDAMMLVYAFTREARPGAFVALVGNKADLESRREVSFKVSNVAMFI